MTTNNCQKCKSTNFTSSRVAASTTTVERWVIECENGHVVSTKAVEAADSLQLEVEQFLTGIAVGSSQNMGGYFITRRAADLFIIDDDTSYNLERTVAFLATTGSAKRMFAKN